MSGRVMRKFRHAGKKAVKFQFTATLERLVVEGTRTWQPHKLSVVWTRRKRRKASSLQSWRPGIENPYKGAVEWSKLNPEVIEIEVTLFKDTRRGQYEAKDWVFVLENEAKNGKRKAIATFRIEMTEHVSEIPSPRPLHIRFKPLTSKLSMASLALMIKCVFLKEGAATDPDMASMIGSTTSDDTIRLGGVDVCDFTDFDDMEDGVSKRSGSLNSRGSSTKNQILEITQQIEMFSKGFKDDGETDLDGNTSLSAANSLKSSSRKPSASGSMAEKSSIASSKSSKEMGDEEKQEIDGKTDKVIRKEENNRNSSASESAEGSEPSPVQKRRLRPSVDVVPFRQSESMMQQSTPTSYGSPASELHRPLLRWCQLVTDGYRGVKVTNFTTSWRNGLAFCSVLHRISPDSIAYSDLKPLDGRDNLKKAFKGFRDLGLNTDEISKAMRTNSGGIATKAIIISFLTEVKEYFDKNNLEDTIEMFRKQKAETKELQKNKRPSLSDFMREKLLSDLEEKDGEDDVFSCELEEVLEKETGPDVLHLSIIEDSGDYQAETTSDLMQASCLEESTRLSTITESPASPKSAKLIEIERTNTFINPAEVPEKELAFSTKSVETNEIDAVINSFSVEIPEFDSSTPITNGDSFDLRAKTEMSAPWQGADKCSSMTDTRPSDECGGMENNDINAAGLASVHTNLVEDSEADPQNKLADGIENIEPESVSEVADDVDGVKDAFSVESTLRDVSSLIDSMQKENTLPSNQKQSDMVDQQPSYSSEDIRSTPEKPMTEKRVKARALIEQFKAQSMENNDDWKTMSLSRDLGSRDGKRREEVRERARKLIEQTRVSLDIKPSAYTRSSECLPYDSQPNGILEDHSSRYSTLPSGKFHSKEKNPEIEGGQVHQQPQFDLDSHQDEEIGLKIDGVNHKDVSGTSGSKDFDLTSDKGLAVSSSIELLNNYLEVEDLSVSQTDEITMEAKSFELEREVEFKESAVPQVKVSPVSPTEVSSFSDFPKFSNHILKTKTGEMQSVAGAISPANKLEEANYDPLGVSTTPESPVIIGKKPADLNGNAVKEQDSRYFMVGSKENIIVTPAKAKQQDMKNLTHHPRESIGDVPDGRFEHLSHPNSVNETELEVPTEKTEDFSHVNISLPESENSISILTLNSPPNDKKNSTSIFPTKGASRGLGELMTTDVKPVANLANTQEETSIIKQHGEAGIIHAAQTPSKKADIPVVKPEETAMPENKHKESSVNVNPATPLRTEAADFQKLKEPITSTPVAEQTPVKYRHPRQQNTTNGPASPSKAAALGSPIRVTAVKPVKLAGLEPFSPILGQEAQEANESSRSRPSSIKVSRRKSSTSSIRKSIAANDTNPLEQEKLALEEEMRTVDDRSLEVQEELQELKNMGRAKSKQREEILMQEWFQLVQKKNAIVRQQDQLLMLEQEHDLGVQVNEINEQLRPYMAIEESQKTEAQKEAEKALLDQLVCLVNERDRIIQTIDENEQTAREDDMHVQTNLDQNMSKVFDQEQEKCAIM